MLCGALEVLVDSLLRAGRGGRRRAPGECKCGTVARGGNFGGAVALALTGPVTGVGGGAIADVGALAATAALPALCTG